MSINEKRRVVITGMGAVSCLGVGVKSLWDGVLAGRSGIGPITLFDATEFRCRIAGEARDFDVEKYMPLKEARRLDRFCHLGIAASDEAIQQSGLVAGDFDPTRAGVLVGSGVGGIETLRTQSSVLENRGPRRSSPLTVPMMIVDMASGAISIRHGFQGPNLAVVTACATASHAIGEAAWIIKRGDADIMLAGGAEACIDPMGLAGFCAMKALTDRNDDPTGASRPFDAGRDGFVPAEGAGVMVLESLESAQKRGAEILAEVVGYGLTGDAYHITAPDPEAEGSSRAIRNAMAQAGLNPSDIGYINAHGTSTPLNDKSETLAIKKALGEAAYKVPVSSTKSMTGHALGAAGGLESAVCVMAMREGVVPPTINYETPDPDCDLDYVPNAPREVAAKTSMNINLGFGGHNAVLMFRKWEQ
jgi:3-oxoacyl-[acyl-carrier-protein] synthase II